MTPKYPLGRSTCTLYLALIAVTTLLISGCVEPYPGWTVIDIRYDDLPSTVKAAFRQNFADARVTKVERSTFESRLSGRPNKFRLNFESPGGESRRIIYDATGKREDGFDFWFDRPMRCSELGMASRFAIHSSRCY